jgi:hypothetical protein
MNQIKNIAALTLLLFHYTILVMLITVINDGSNVLVDNRIRISNTFSIGNKYIMLTGLVALLFGNKIIRVISFILALAYILIVCKYAANFNEF